eukprot:scaffold18539_cov99-Isochrysis_galbana.AAC.2
MTHDAGAVCNGAPLRLARAIPDPGEVIYDAPPRRGWPLRGKGKRVGASRRLGRGRARRGYSGGGGDGEAETKNNLK